MMRALRRAAAALSFVLVCGLLPGSQATAFRTTFLRHRSASSPPVTGSWDTSGGAYLQDTSPPINYNADYTVAGWYKPSSAGTNQRLIELYHDGDFLGEYVGHINYGMRVDSLGSGSSDQDTEAAFSMSDDVWYYIALRRTGDVVDVIRDGTIVATVTVAVGSRAAADVLNISRSGGQAFTGLIAHQRAWSDDLSLTELDDEAPSATAVRTSGLLLDLGTVQADGAGHDNSGAGNHLTETGGTLTWDAESPL